MLECRYNGNCCVMYHRPFDSDELPCDGYDVDICSLYKPMPDVEALKELVRMFESDAALVYPYQLDESTANETLYTRANVLSHIYRMREALGEVR